MKKYVFVYIALLTSLYSMGQSNSLNKAHTMLQGRWKMHSDTTVILIFTTDSVILRLQHKEIQGYAAAYILHNESCDTTHYGNRQGVFIRETYSFAHSRRPHEMKTCCEITEITDKRLVIKDNETIVVYDKK
jgi:hypothetical protein